MKTASLSALIATAILTASSPALALFAKEGGGRESQATRFACEEQNPQDPQNPYLAKLSLRRGSILELLVREHNGAHLWAGQVALNERILCRGPCEIYEGNHFGTGQMTFHVNTYPQPTATFSFAGKVIQFRCKGYVGSEE